MSAPKKRKRGRPRTEPTVVQNVTTATGRVGVRYSVELAEKVANVAKREGTSVSELMRACVEVLVESRAPAMWPHVKEILRR